MHAPFDSALVLCRLLAATGLLAGLLAVPAATAATFTVGGDPACTHATVQAAINAAQSAQEPSVIRISRSAAYVQQGLVVNANRNLELAGGYADCAQTTADAAKTTLDGAGGAAASVLRIIASAGVTVVVRTLRVQGGDPAGENAGGGIFFGGSGTLEIHDSDIVNNVAGNGGGIYAGGAAPGAKLVIGAEVVITGNEARFSGGGVFIDGLDMTMVEPDCIIAFNSALGTSTTGYGGGVFIRGLTDRPGIVRIGSGGLGASGVIYGNEARVGGGVSLGTPSFEGLARLYLFTTTPGQPAAIRGNLATVAGGGLFVQSRRSSIVSWVDAIAELWNAEITDNQAPSGAAAYLAHTGDHGGLLRINLSPPAGAVSCTTDSACGAISGNVAALPNGQATDGAIIQVEEHATLLMGGDFGTNPTVAGIRLSENRGGRLIDVQPEGSAALHNALMVDNELSVHLLRYQSSEDLVRLPILDSTIAGNAISSGDVLAVNGNLELRRSILWQPGMTSLSQSGGELAVSNVIASEAASLGGAPLAIVAEPRFIDPAGGDYRLRAASPAVDFAPPIEGDDRDISNRPRDQDLGLKPNAEGVRDIGAFERQSLDPLVLNGTFDTDLNLWPQVTPGSTTWDGTQSTGAPVPSGSAKVSGTPVGGTRLIGASQCVHLPGPGRYKLNGYGMTTFAVGVQRDSVILHWDLRRDGGELCDVGSIDAAGDHLLTRGTSFATAAQPAVIDVPPEAWTPNSSIAISLVMVDNGLAIPGQVTGWFDRVTLTGEPLSDVIFADGFE